jgi:hypothetical protein
VPESARYATTPTPVTAATAASPATSANPTVTRSTPAATSPAASASFPSGETGWMTIVRTRGGGTSFCAGGVSRGTSSSVTRQFFE